MRGFTEFEVREFTKRVKSGVLITDLLKPEIDLRLIKNFTYANCAGANLANKDISDCDFSYANLTGASMNKVIARGTNFSFADLSKANMSGGYFKNANFYGTNCPHVICKGADFQNANLCKCIFTWGTRAHKGAKITKKQFDALMRIYDVIDDPQAIEPVVDNE